MNTASRHCVIVGGSHAAAQLAPGLRQAGWDGRIMLISADSVLPYHRPPLSKTFLSGGKSVDEILIRHEGAYKQLDIELMLVTRVAFVDRDRRRLHLDNGSELPYDKLALATGARVRKLNAPGSDLPGVLYLRDLHDALALRDALRSVRRAVIVGGGYIGLETAASLRALGIEVTVLEALPRVLQRVTAPQVSEFYTRVHREEGVTILTGAAVESFEGHGRVERVVCVDGMRIEAELVVVGIGVVPETTLAETAGLAIDNGIVVDEFARTGNPDIVAAGDCTHHYNPIYDTHLRLESVQNAVEQAKVAAGALCGKLEAYHSLPWFWSDQYDLKLQIAGLSQGHDEVILRGDPTSGRSFAAFYLRQGRLLAVDAINRPKEFMLCKRALAKPCIPDRQKLADESVNIQEIL